MTKSPFSRSFHLHQRNLWGFTVCFCLPRSIEWPVARHQSASCCLPKLTETIDLGPECAPMLMSTVSGGTPQPFRFVEGCFPVASGAPAVPNLAAGIHSALKARFGGSETASAPDPWYQHLIRRAGFSCVACELHWGFASRGTLCELDRRILVWTKWMSN